MLFAVGGYRGAYAALDARSGKILSSFPTTAPMLAPSIAIGNLVVTADYAGPCWCSVRRACAAVSSA